MAFEKMRLNEFVKKACIDILNGIDTANKELGTTTKKILFKEETYEEKKIKDLSSINFDICIYHVENEVYVKSCSENPNTTNLKFSISFNSQDS